VVDVLCVAGGSAGRWWVAGWQQDTSQDVYVRPCLQLTRSTLYDNPLRHPDTCKSSYQWLRACYMHTADVFTHWSAFWLYHRRLWHVFILYTCAQSSSLPCTRV